MKEAQFNSAIVEALGVTLNAVVAPAEPRSRPFRLRHRSAGYLHHRRPGPVLRRHRLPHQPQRPCPFRSQSVSVRSTGAGDWHIRPPTALQRLARWPTSARPPTSTSPCPLDAEVNQGLLPSQGCRAVLLRPRQRRLPRPAAARPILWRHGSNSTVDGVQVRTGQAVQTVQHVVGRGGVYEPLLDSARPSPWLPPPPPALFPWTTPGEPAAR